MLSARSIASLLIAVVGIAAGPSLAQAQAVSRLSFAQNPASGNGMTNGMLTTTKAAGSSGLTVTLDSSDNAIAEVPGTVVVASGSTTATFIVTTGHVSAAAKTIITAKAGGKSISETLTVEPPTVRLSKLSISPTIVQASEKATATVTLTADAPATGFTLHLAAAKSFVSIPAGVTVEAGQRTATFTVGTSFVSSSQMATIVAIDPDDYQETATLTVEPPTVRVVKVAVSPASVTASKAVTGTVTLSADAPKDGFIVNLSSSQTFITVPKTVTVKAGAKTAAFTGATKPVSSAGRATIAAQDAAGYSADASVAVNPPSVYVTGVSIVPTSIPGGNTATGTVTLSAVAPSSGFVLNLSTMQSTITLPLTVKVKAGMNSGTFTISSTTVSSASPATVSAADVNGYTATGSVLVNPSAAAATVSMTSALTFSPQSVTVAAGSTVMWNNTAAMGHTVATDLPALGISSGNVAPGQAFCWTVPANAKSGTMYFYHCQYHGFPGNGTALGEGMVGVIVVK